MAANCKRALCILPFLVAGCAANTIDPAIQQYQAVAGQIQLGDSLQRVTSILEPTQEGLESKYRKQPEAYLENGKRTDIYFYRSGRQPDDLTTDDEFTPYVFTDGLLTSIGWQTLGGPKSTGQARDTTRVVVQPQPEKRCTTIYQTTKGYQTICN